MLNKRCKDKQ